MEKERKQRADVLLAERGLCESRSLAQKLILAGQVRVGSDHVVQKANEKLPENCELRIQQLYPYVSRGAEKLVPALDRFLPDLTGRVALDLGASTGGFTDLMLQRGAERVYAVDVGYGQLHQKLREHDRVISLERINARDLSSDLIPDPIDILTADVSFISLRKVLPSAAPLLKPGAWVFVLVKPQFEARREEVGKGGVVRDQSVRRRCVKEIAKFANSELGWERQGMIPSPITGPKGNQEFILVLTG
jgi:23S rRNA (cytidine1920-2'-O)/16S rRNA (cytidine1409-2'-O)-methyltransferase